MTSQERELLSITEVSRNYGPVAVLKDCSLQVHAGEIHALLGANGAGKSTLVRIIAGLLPPTSGHMQLNGAAFAPTSRQEAADQGVQIVQQELNLIPTLSVAENLYLNRMPHQWGIARRRELHQRSRQALDRFDLQDIATDACTATLGVGHQQMLEIASALDRNCRLLILDEPTAALSAPESATLFRWLRKLRAAGVGIIYISHRLQEVADLADRISILRDGRMTGTHHALDVTPDDMVRLMSGSGDHATEVRPFVSHARPTVAMAVNKLSRGMVQQVSFQVRHGERLGIAGLVGCGRTELLRSIFGADPAEAGDVTPGQCNQSVRFSDPAQAVAAGIVMLTEDRKQNGLLLTQSVTTNMTLSSLWKNFSRRAVLQRDREADTAEKMCRQLRILCSGIDQPASMLSGGNQQKVAIARWLIRDADVFLLDEPTRGIDVAARRHVHQLIDELAESGKAVVVVSSETQELLEVCDRILVMSNGQLVAEVTRDTETNLNWTEDKIMQAAFSGYAGTHQTKTESPSA